MYFSLGNAPAFPVLFDRTPNSISGLQFQWSIMKKTLLLLVIFLVCLLGMGQTPNTAASPQAKTKPPSPFAEYVGDWISSFDGRVWLRLRLVVQSDKLTGAMIHARNITTDDSGGLKSVSDEQSRETLADAVLNPDGLLLTLKDADSQETERYLMRLILPAKQTAELKLIGQAMPPGMAKPTPWQLVKSVSTVSPSRQ